MGLSQNEQGWRPSRAQIICPQDRQLGAGSKRGWIVAWQPQTRRSELRAGLVESSRAAIAAVRSLILEVVVVVDL